jgi:choline-phosphate cytidylyltransferase/glycerol-3-phosphate cytidylyltransferase
LVKKLNVDRFVIGDDWTGKYDYLRELGVEVFYFPYGKGVSSTNIKEQISQNYKSLVRKVDEHGNPDIVK